MSDDRWFERLAKGSEEMPGKRAPARLKSRVYSALVERMAAAGPLLDLPHTQQRGGQLCVFESAVALLPLGPALQSRNPCRVCHARILGERLDHAPIFWPGCPYSDFHRG